MDLCSARGARTLQGSLRPTPKSGAAHASRTDRVRRATTVIRAFMPRPLPIARRVMIVLGLCLFAALGGALIWGSCVMDESEQAP